MAVSYFILEKFRLLQERWYLMCTFSCCTMRQRIKPIAATFPGPCYCSQLESKASATFNGKLYCMRVTSAIGTKTATRLCSCNSSSSNEFMVMTSSHKTFNWEQHSMATVSSVTPKFILVAKVISRFFVVDDIPCSSPMYRNKTSRNMNASLNSGRTIDMKNRHRRSTFQRNSFLVQLCNDSFMCKITFCSRSL